MDDATSEPRRCEVCDDPIRRNNKYGICSDQTKPACEKTRRLKREGRSESEQKTCAVCGAPIRCDNKTGICNGRGKPECTRVRQRIERGHPDPMGPPPRIVIKASDVFGLWTALEDYTVEDKRVLVRCECGIQRRVRGSKLIVGESTSCGCVRYVTRADRKAPYLTAGSVFNRLTSLEDVATCNDYARFG